MRKILLFLFLIVVVSIFGIWWFGNSKQATTPVYASKMETNVVSSPQTNITITTIAKSETNHSDKADTNSVAAKYKEYLAGKINKVEMMQAVISERNMQNQDFYGKVIDQYGNPVIGAMVKGNVMLDGLTTSKEETHITQTDRNGFFQFTGLHGFSLGVAIIKVGYKIGEHGEGYQAPVGEKPSPNNRAILTMWKLRGPEPLNNSSIETKIPHDGTPVTFSIDSGKKSLNGDFRVTLSQYPLEVDKGWEKFDWSVKVEILNGGLVEESDAYPYSAPADGYQQSFEFNESTNAVKWFGGLKKKYYIKTTQGQYGLMQLKVFPGRSPTGLEAYFTINPSGSQNLEPKE